MRPSPSSSAVSLPQMMRSLPLNFFRGISNVGLMIMVSESIHRYHSISGCSCNQHSPSQHSHTQHVSAAASSSHVQILGCFCRQQLCSTTLCVYSWCSHISLAWSARVESNTSWAISHPCVLTSHRQWCPPGIQNGYDDSGLMMK